MIPRMTTDPWEAVARVAGAGLAARDEDDFRHRLEEVAGRLFPGARVEWDGPAGRPLEIDGRRLGTLSVVPADPRLLDAVLPVAARALDRVRLMDRSTLDPLTRLPVRARFCAEFEDAVASARRPLSLLLVDGDHLKDKNEVYGSAAVDGLLRDLGGLLAARFPEATRGRWDGDRFPLVLSVDDPREAAEELRRLIEGRAFPEDLRCTVSIGVASHRAGEPASALFARAEDAVRAAKRAGGNRVEIAR
jgi:diguanylate cyclase (GGDEF)-like protein